MFVVYCYSDTRPFYIGEGSPKRPYSHWNKILVGKKTHNWRLTTHLKKMHADGHSPIISILHHFETKQEALTAEEQLITKYGRLNDGGCLFNICRNSIDTTAKSARPKKTLSEQHRNAISKGLKSSELAKAGRIEAGKKLKDKPRSNMIREKIRTGHLGKPKPKLTAEHKAAISLALSGRTFSDIHCMKISEALAGKTHKGQKRTCFLIKRPDGSLVTLHGGLELFCAENHINRKSLYNTLKRGTPIRFGANRGWQLIETTSL